jgi:signal transduction histidine kinase
MPCALGELHTSSTDESGESTRERLCCDVVTGRVDSLHPHVSERGSFWTNDVSDGLVSERYRSRSSAVDSLHPAGRFKSIALFPIRTEAECIGLLQLKSADEGFFSADDLSFFEDISEVLGVALSHQYAQIELRERVKELTCLYGIARVVGQLGASIDEVLQGVTELLPPAWLYPEITCARIVVDGRAYTTDGFRETPFRQVAEIVVDKRKVGFVEVVYIERKLTMDEGPFLVEERNLIDSVAREVGIFYQRTVAESEKASLHDQLRHADRLATIGQLAAGVAHELNEPLANILGFAQLAKKTPDLEAQVEKDLLSIETASLHAREIIRKLMTFSRQLPPKKTPVQLNDLVEEGLYYFEARCVKAGIALVLDLAKDLPVVTMDAGQMNQVLVNLVVNAIQAMPDGGQLTVGTREMENGICLSVKDTGVGISEEVKDQVFLPFFTTKDVNEGTGLGLAVIHGIVKSHGGDIEFQTDEHKGTEFQVYIPLESPGETQ